MVGKDPEVDDASAGPGATSAAQPRLCLSSVLPAPDSRQREGGLTIFGQTPCSSPFVFGPTTAATVVLCPWTPIVQGHTCG